MQGLESCAVGRRRFKSDLQHMKIKEFPKEYIKKGHFILHSGEVTDTFYDVNAMLTDKLDDIKWWAMQSVRFCDSVVGIATGGAIIASQFDKFAMIKDGELKGTIEGEYCLIDDVVTTENSLVDAIKIIGQEPKKIFTVVDRRKKKTLEIESMYRID